MRTILFSLSIPLLLASCDAGTATNSEQTNSASEPGDRLMHVTTLQLQPQRFEHFFKVQGVVESEYNAQLFPEVNGKIIRIEAAEGQKVSKGQILIVLDGKVIANQIGEIRSRLELAKTVYERQEKLWDQNIGSEMQFLEAKNNYTSLAQNLETLESQQAMYTIRAPFAGVVDEILPKVGEMVGPMMPVIRLINLEEVYMKADVTEGYLDRINEGDSVLIRFPSIDGSAVSTIARIGNFINPNNRTFKVRVDLQNNRLNLKPNMLGEMMIRDYESDTTAVVPSNLIQMTPSGEEFVYVIESAGGNDVARKVTVRSGMSQNGSTEIIEGLSGNERLVDKGARSINEGDTIIVSNREL